MWWGELDDQQDVGFMSLKHVLSDTFETESQM